MFQCDDHLFYPMCGEGRFFIRLHIHESDSAR